MNDPFTNRERLYGPEGYTAVAVEILTPWLCGTWGGGIQRFDEVPAEIAEHIARHHLPTDLTEMHLERDPSILELVEAAIALPAGAHLHGYVVEAKREDERIVFDTLCWTGKRPAIITQYRPRSLERHNGWHSAWWH